MERYFQIEMNNRQPTIVEESINDHSNPVFFGNELALLDLP